MFSARLLRLAAVSALLCALPAVLAAAPLNTSRRDTAPVSVPARTAAPIVKAERTQPPAASFGNLSRAPLSQRPVAVESPRVATSSGSSQPNASGLSAAHQDLGPLGLKPAFTAPTVLYAVADSDDPALRAAVAAITGGAVDYFDANASTPTAAQLAAYSCVYTYPNANYNNLVLMGDRLADYVDAGGKVILGPFCTYTSGSPLGGRIMTAAYSPVTSTLGNNHFLNSAYTGDGFRSMHAGVLAYDCMFRDVLILQGAGIANGHYADGEIAHAYRPDGRVIYSNGSGSAGLGGTGDWAKLIANAARGNPSAHGMLMAPSDADDAAYRGDIGTFTTGVVDYFDAGGSTPSAALLNTYDCIYTWPNGPYNDEVLFGDRLADRVDAGGRAILGGFSTYTAGNFLSGRIMTPNYCPVTSPNGSNHVSVSAYAGDGTSQFTNGAVLWDAPFRDFLIGQGAGIVVGHYNDGEIAAAIRPDGRVIYYNGGGSASMLGTGDWPRLIADGCEAVAPSGRRILYAPADDDLPQFRAQINENTGGTVDYFDARVATPAALTLSNYDCVYTWVNYSYQDRVLFGDRLADFVDAGGKVILGSFTTYTTGSSLGGRIMTAPYSPVTSPTGTNHFAPSAYAGDAATCFHHGVVAYDSQIRDFLALQGAGIAESHYADGEIAFAYRPDRRVVYLNGLGIYGVGNGDWPRLIANAAERGDTPGVMFATNDAARLYTINTKTGVGTFDLNLPTFGGVGSNEIEYLPVSGTAWLSGRDGTFTGEGVNLFTGAPTTAALGAVRDYNGLEYALGGLYGIGIPGPCGPSTLVRINTANGLEFLVLGPTGLGPIVGLAFDARWSVLYGLTSGCIGPSNLVRIDVTNGVGTVLGPTPVRLASLEFGPDGDLYGGGDVADGGNLYRINQMTGFTRFIGNTGMGDVSGLTVGPQGSVAAEPSSARLEFSTPYPNPSRKGAVQFRFSVPSPCNARLELYDVAGRMRWRQDLIGLEAGPHSVSWNGLASNGARLSSGVYHMLFVTPAGQRSVRIVRLD